MTDQDPGMQALDELTKQEQARQASEGGGKSIKLESPAEMAPVEVNKYHLPDGSVRTFPLGTSEASVRQQLGFPAKPQNYGSPLRFDGMFSLARPMVSGALSQIAMKSVAPLAAAQPEIGIPAMLGAENLGYVAPDMAMKYTGGALGIGEKPTSFGVELVKSERDALINSIGGRFLSAFYKGAKGASSALYNVGMPDVYKLNPTVSGAILGGITEPNPSGIQDKLYNYAWNKVASTSKFLEMLAPGINDAAMKRMGVSSEIQALAVANKINGKLSGTNADPSRLYEDIKDVLEQGTKQFEPQQHLVGKYTPPGYHITKDALDALEQGAGDYTDKLNAVLGNSEKLEKFLKAGSFAGSPAINVRQDMGAYQFMKLVRQAEDRSVAGQIQLNPKSINNYWNDPENQKVKDLLYSKDTQDMIGDFFKDLTYTQGKKPNVPQGMIMRYVGGPTGRFFMGASLLSGALHMTGVTGAGVYGFEIPAYAVAKMLGSAVNSKVAGKVLLQIANQNITTPLPMVSKVLTGALQGTALAAVGSDGTKHEGRIELDKDGMARFVPDK